jgi:hypothetical protein
MCKRLLLILGRLLFVIFAITWLIVGITSGLVIQMIYYLIIIPISWLIVGDFECLPDFNIRSWVCNPLDYVAKLFKI